MKKQLIQGFIYTIRPVILGFIRFWFRIRIFNRENVPGSPPYFVVAAHRNHFDPVFIGIAIPHAIRHVCTDEMFRGAVRRKLFQWAGAIPEKRYKNDFQLERQIIDALNDGYAVGIFPEGERSWTGEMQSLRRESLRLLKHYHHIPILPIILEGNYHSWPRWSNRLLKAKQHVTFGKPFFLGPTTDIEEMELIVSEKIRPRKEHEKLFSCMSKDRTGQLSIVVYRCPACMRLETLKEIPPASLVCRACKRTIAIKPDFEVSYISHAITCTSNIDTLYRKIKIRETDMDHLSFRTIPDEDVTGSGTPETIIYYAKGSCYLEAESKFKRVAEGEIMLTNHDLSVFSHQHTSILDLKDLDAVTIESNRKLQLYQGKKDLLTVCFESSSVLLWQDFIVLLLEKLFGKKVIT